MSSSITVVIADRDKANRAAYAGALQPEKGISVAGVARNGLEAIMAAGMFKPRVLLINLNLFKGKKNNLLRALRESSPRTKILLLTGQGAGPPILEMLSRGARGYISEASAPAFLPKAVRMVEAGQAWVPRKMVTRIIERLQNSNLAT